VTEGLTGLMEKALKANKYKGLLVGKDGIKISIL